MEDRTMQTQQEQSYLTSIIDNLLDTEAKLAEAESKLVIIEEARAEAESYLCEIENAAVNGEISKNAFIKVSEALDFSNNAM